MKNQKKFLAIIILDLITCVSMILGITFSIFDVRFMANYPRLSSLPILMTFTGLSNVFIGLVCLGCAIYRLYRKETKLSKPLFLLKIIALADITITFVITATYLSINLGSSWWRLYINNNLFNHFFSTFSIPSTSCFTKGPSLHSKMTEFSSMHSSLCHTPLGMFTP